MGQIGQIDENEGQTKNMGQYGEYRATGRPASIVISIQSAGEKLV